VQKKHFHTIQLFHFIQNVRYMSFYSYGPRCSKDLNWVVVSVLSSNAPLPIFVSGKFSHAGNKKNSM
jgi:hypothetical protein